MNQQLYSKKEGASIVATSFVSIIFSLIASSHHWLHMGILFLLGSSTNMMVMMSGVLWVRRTMMILTLITAIYSIFGLYKKQMPKWMKGINIVSIIISLSFIVYTVITFGW